MQAQPTFDSERYSQASNAVNSLIYRLSSQATDWPHVIAVLTENGYLNPHNVREAEKILNMKENLEEQKRIAGEAEQRAKFEAFNSPEQAYPRIFNRRNGDPNELQAWFKKTATGDLETLLKQLKGNPYHWKSLYLGGRISDAIELLENEVAKRKNGVKN